MKIIRCIVLCVLLVNFKAYATPSSNKSLIDKIERLENQILLLEKRVVDLQHLLNAQTSSAANNASLHSRLLALEEKMQELNGKFEYFDHTFQQVLERIRNLSADVDYRFNQLGRKQETNAMSINSTKSSPESKRNEIMTTSSFKNDEELIAQGKYSKAIANLEKYINDNKANNLAGEAYYLIGMAHLKQKFYDKAAIHYLKSYKNYPNNTKAADSLLALSKSLIKLNKKTKACSILDKLEKEYPDRSTENKQQTIDMVGKLGCQ